MMARGIKICGKKAFPVRHRKEIGKSEREKIFVKFTLFSYSVNKYANQFVSC
jgi:hypothetical protein